VWSEADPTDDRRTIRTGASRREYALIAHAARTRPDNRTQQPLLGGSVDRLQALVDVWGRSRTRRLPLQAMRLVADYQPPDPCARGSPFFLPTRSARGIRLQHREPRVTTALEQRRRRAFRPDAVSKTRRRRPSSVRRAGWHLARPRETCRRALWRRRRRQFDCRDAAASRQAPRPQPVELTFSVKPFAATSDISQPSFTPPRPMRVWAAARRSLQRSLGCGTEGKPSGSMIALSDERTVSLLLEWGEKGRGDRTNESPASWQTASCTLRRRTRGTGRPEGGEGKVEMHPSPPWSD